MSFAHLLCRRQKFGNIQLVRKIGLIEAVALAALLILPAAAMGQFQSPYGQWTNGPSADASYFPIGVWLQSPTRANQYKAAGFNTYVGLWQGPTETQLSQLANAGMKAICHQNSVGLNSPNRGVIIAWSQQDEPDNAQPLPEGGYGPPVLPSEIVSRYNTIKAADDTRPVFLNLGQGVAWDGWHGRGTRTNHPEDYPEYLKGTDIGSFDIYPFASQYTAVKDKPWLVPFGVDRMISWTTDKQIVWNFIECTNISGNGKATPTQTRAEVWMSLVHGSRGILYFVHQISPTFIEPALLYDAPMLEMVSFTNNQIHRLAPVLNSPTIVTGATAAVSNAAVPVDTMVKKHDGATYLFAVGMRDGSTSATFTLAEPLNGTVEVIDEERTLTVSGGVFTDDFSPYAVHLYRIVSVSPQITAWRAYATHGTAGLLGRTIQDNDVEPRKHVTQLGVTFDFAIDPQSIDGETVMLTGGVSGDLSNLVSSVTLDASGRNMTIDLSQPLHTDQSLVVTISSTLRGTDGSALDGTRSIMMRLLPGDVDGSGRVEAADMRAIRQAVGQSLTAGNCHLDVDGSGAISGNDLREVRGRLGTALP